MKKKNINNNTSSVKKPSPEPRTVAPQKLKLLFTVINRSKAEFYIDLLHSFEVNMQMTMAAWGTASTEMLNYLGLTDSEKSVIISVVRRDKSRAALAELEEKFKTVKGGKGIAYTVPLTSTVGVAIYQFLSNTQGGGMI